MKHATVRLVRLFFISFRLLLLVVHGSDEADGSDLPLNALKTSANDLYPLNVDSNLRPDARAFHSMTASDDGSYLFVFGGILLENGGLTETYLGDSHVYDLRVNGWTGELNREWCCSNNEIQDTLGPAPQSRARHRAVAIPGGNEIWLYGGRGPSVLQGGAPELKGDLHRFDLATLTWSGELATTGPTPPPRAGHAMAASADGRTLHVWGGQGEDGPLGDLWRFDVGRRRWAAVAQAGEAPAPRADFGFAVDAEAEVLYLFGGRTDGTDAAGGHVFADTYALDLATATWSRLECPGTTWREDLRRPVAGRGPRNRPAARYAPAAAVLPLAPGSGGGKGPYLAVWGGLAERGASAPDDFGVLDAGACAWYVDWDARRALPAAGEARPAPRHGQAAAAVPAGAGGAGAAAAGWVYEFGGVVDGARAAALGSPGPFTTAWGTAGATARRAAAASALGGYLALPDEGAVLYAHRVVAAAAGGDEGGAPVPGLALLHWE